MCACVVRVRACIGVHMYVHVLAFVWLLFVFVHLVGASPAVQYLSTVILSSSHRRNC